MRFISVRKSIVFVISFITFFSLFGSSVSAAQLLLRSSDTSVRQRENFNVEILAEPSGQRVYTVKSSLTFPADLVEVNSWKYGDSWMGLSQSGFDLTDNSTGILMKTAGYPRGIATQQMFGVVTFLAKTTGSGSIVIDPRSVMYNSSNKNIFIKGDSLSFSIKKALPNQLFDIRLELDRDVYSQISEVEARVLFESFGTEPTPVNLRIYLDSPSGNVVDTKEASLTVQTRDIFSYRFPQKDLPDGRYTVRVVTSYNNGVTDEFKQTFQLRSPVAWYAQPVLGYSVALILLLLAGAIVIYRKKR